MMAERGDFIDLAHADKAEAKKAYNLAVINSRKELFTDVKNLYSEYLDASPENLELLVLWMMGTYFHSQFETYPILQLLAQKRSGKTRTLKLLSSLSFKSDGSTSASMTEAELFRHKEGAVFFDEIESINTKEKSSLRELLNTIYKRGSRITRHEMRRSKEKDEYQPVYYYPYYPLALANINGLGDVLADRAVQIILQRSNSVQTLKVEDFASNSRFKSIKERLSVMHKDIPVGLIAAWNDFVDGILPSPELLPLFKSIKDSGIHGRPLEVFFPLLVVAHLCGCSESFIVNVKERVLEKEEEDAAEDYDELLKTFINANKVQLCSLCSVCSLCSLFREQMAIDDEFVNRWWVGRALKRLGLVKKKVRRKEGVYVLLK